MVIRPLLLPLPEVLGYNIGLGRRICVWYGMAWYGIEVFVFVFVFSLVGVWILLSGWWGEGRELYDMFYVLCFMS